MSEPFIRLESISKTYKTKDTTLQVLKDLSLDVPKGEKITIVGPNGSGKSTLLNCIAGMIQPDSGKIISSDNRPITKIKTSYIVQNSHLSLFPWKALWDNITFPLELQGIGKQDRKEKAENLVKELGLEKILTDLNQYPYQISGGQKQACNIARAIAHDPELLLIDEGFVGLDLQARFLIEDKLLEILEKKKLTSIIISHDIEEAVYLSNYVAVLTKKPTHVLETVRINLEEPRTRSMIESNEFFVTKNKILALFKKGEQMH